MDKDQLAQSIAVFSRLLKTAPQVVAERMAAVADPNGGNREAILSAGSRWVDRDFLDGVFADGELEREDSVVRFRGFSARDADRHLDVLCTATNLVRPILVEELAQDDVCAEHWMNDVLYGHWDQPGPNRYLAREAEEFQFAIGPPSASSDWKQHPRDPFVYTRFLAAANDRDSAMKKAQERGAGIFEYAGELAFAYEDGHALAPMRRNFSQGTHLAAFVDNTTLAERRIVHEVAHGMHVHAMMYGGNTAAKHGRNTAVAATAGFGKQALEDSVPYVHPLRIKQFCLAARDQTPPIEIAATAILALDRMANDRDDGQHLRKEIEECVLHSNFCGREQPDGMTR